MKNKLFLVFGLLLAALTASGQTALTSTTLSAAITVNQTVFAVASATGIVATNPRTQIYVVDAGGTGRGELMTVQAVSGTTLTVSRLGINKAAHPNGSFVIIPANPSVAQSFQTYNPTGSCTAAQTLYTPWINTTTGEQWLCSTATLAWVPGFNNPNRPQMTATVASAAGLVVPSGPLFVISGALAITGFTLPQGFTGGGFCVLPTGTFTWTTATNIGLAGTAVVGRTLCFTWNSVSGKWHPSYVS